MMVLAPQSDQTAPMESASSQSSLTSKKIFRTYHFPEPKIKSSNALEKTQKNYVSVTMNGLPQYYETGLPVLPFMTVKILLPFGTKFEQVRVTPGKKTPLFGSHLVEYGQKVLPLTIESPRESPINLPNEILYCSSDPFPGKLYSDISVQSKMGYKIVLINFYPVEYIPATGKLFYYESIRLEIEIASDEEGEKSSFKGFLQKHNIIKDIVDNPEILETYPISLQNPTYQYVIITNEDLNSTLGPYNFQALRDDKISRGISATIVTVEWIYENYNGTRPDGAEDNQTQIRNFIIDAYNDWGTIYVLLGGDGDGGDVGGESGDKIIPHRGFYGMTGTRTDDDIPADMYYGCLDGTFDYDSDGLYGESNDGPNGGEVDLFAEVYVGRACVDSQTEVQNFVKKTLAYQTADTTAEQHLEKVWMVGEDMDDWPGDAKWGGNFKDEIKEGSNTYGYTSVGFENSPYATGFSVSTLYDRDYIGNDWPKSAVIDLINDNAHLINHQGHSNVNDLMKMNNFDVENSLTNNELFFIGYSQGCYCGAFDNRFGSNAYSYSDCIVEHLTTENHGAVAFVANSRYGLAWPYTTDGPSQHFDREFWDAVLGEGILNIGIANQDSKEDNAGRVINAADRWCFYELNLFGDPELMIILPLANEHELTLSLDTPVYPEFGDSFLLNATVYNRGSNNETNVELFLIINNSIVESESISELVSGSSFTLVYPWTPAKEGIYNVTAFVSPVSGESVTENNVKSANVQVYSFPDILVVDDNDGRNGPNKLTSLENFELALIAAGYDYMVWNESSMSNPPLELLTKFKLVIWTCGDFYNWAIDPTDVATLDGYLVQGGNIILEGDDIGVNHEDEAFMENVAHGEYGEDDTNPNEGLTVTDSEHPITQDLPTSLDWIYTPIYPDGISPVNGGTEVIRYTGTSWSAITVFEGPSSKVVYIAFSLRCLNSSKCETLILNTLNWILPSTSTQDSYLVVRGSNNIIYYRTYDIVSSIWNTWTGLPGSTPDTPAAVVCGNQLHIVVRGMDGASLFHGYVDLLTDEFSGWSWISGSTPSIPRLASDENSLYLVVRGDDNRIYYRRYDLVSESWGTWNAVPTGSTMDAPGACIDGDYLHLVVRGMDDSIYHQRVYLPTLDYLGWSNIGGTTPSVPSLTSNYKESGDDHMVYLVVRGSDNRIYLRSFDGSWSGWTKLPGSTNDAFGACIQPSLPDDDACLHIVVRGMDGAMYHGKYDLNSESFLDWSWMSGSTPSPPTLTS